MNNFSCFRDQMSVRQQIRHRDPENNQMRNESTKNVVFGRKYFNSVGFDSGCEWNDESSFVD